MMPDLPARASELTKVVRELTTRIDKLTTAQASYAQAQQVQKDDLRRHKRAVRAAITAMVLDIILTFVAGYLVVNQVALNKQSLITTNEVLCPFLALALSSYQPDTVPAGQRDFYENAFIKLRVMRAKLQCPGE